MNSESREYRPSESLQGGYWVVGGVFVALLLLAMSRLISSSGSTGPLNLARPAYEPGFDWVAGSKTRILKTSRGHAVDGRIWITARIGTPAVQSELLFDIPSRTVLGRLQDGIAQTLPQQGRFLCYSLEDMPLSILGERIGHLPDPMNLGHFPPETQRKEFWTLGIDDPLEKTRMGHVYVGPGGKAPGFPSPQALQFHTRDSLDYQRNYLLRGALYSVFNLEVGSYWSLRSKDWWVGWVNDSEALIWNPGGDLAAVDVRSDERRVIVQPDTIEQFLAANNLPGGGVRPFQVSGNNRIYLRPASLRIQGWIGSIDAQNGELALIQRHFDFVPGGVFNSELTHYLHRGHDTGDKHAVYVRDVATGNSEQIVEHDPKGRAASPPTFHRNQVIFCRSDAIWICDLDGSNRERLFPPAVQRSAARAPLSTAL
jgi:hypothetical protein